MIDDGQDVLSVATQPVELPNGQYVALAEMGVWSGQDAIDFCAWLSEHPAGNQDGHGVRPLIAPVRCRANPAPIGSANLEVEAAQLISCQLGTGPNGWIGIGVGGSDHQTYRGPRRVSTVWDEVSHSVILHGE